MGRKKETPEIQTIIIFQMKILEWNKDVTYMNNIKHKTI